MDSCVCGMGAQSWMSIPSRWWPWASWIWLWYIFHFYQGIAGTQLCWTEKSAHESFTVFWAQVMDLDRTPNYCQWYIRVSALNLSWIIPVYAICGKYEEHWPLAYIKRGHYSSERLFRWLWLTETGCHELAGQSVPLMLRVFDFERRTAERYS